MMDGVKILSALFLVAMLIYLFPRMKSSLQHSPKGNTDDWIGLLLPMLAVVGFVVLLIYLV
jgi:flagellar biogenesis protein FliO